MQKTLRQA